VDGRIPPLLSTSVYGPLGLKHLPRLWLKILLHACGRLPEGYRHGTGGFDEALTTAVGIDNAAFIAYIQESKPSYVALEAWVRKHATNLTADSIAAFNAHVENAQLPEAMRADRFARIGFSDPSYTNAIALNNLDDWAAMHEELAGAAST
jgi:hypothetical protein